jgi:SAM-dependent methyltransferase
MLFLSNEEKAVWSRLGRDVVARATSPGDFREAVREPLLPVFRLYTGVLLYAQGQETLGQDWIRAGAMEESESLMLNVFLSSFLERQHGRLIMPAVCFEDPKPYIHFTGVPEMGKMRRNFAEALGHSLPRIAGPARIIDVGCGDGGMLAILLEHLRQAGKIGDIGAILLIDPSAAMIEKARATLSAAFPGVEIRAVDRRIEAAAAKLDEKYDIAINALAYHHMPLEHKRLHLGQIKPWIDHFVLFELDSNNDSPEVGTPEMALSAYQAYGRMIQFVFAHDAPVDLACHCVDNFLMTELVSILTQPRGRRTDYHMLQKQWLDLFEEVLAPEFSLGGYRVCHADENFHVFMAHYAREAGA